VGIFGENAAWREGSQLEHPKKPTAGVNSEVAVRCTDLDAKKAESDKTGDVNTYMWGKKQKQQKKLQIRRVSNARKDGRHMQFATCKITPNESVSTSV